MGYNRGTFRRGTVNSRGAKGRRTERFNAAVTKSGFKQLASAVQYAAGLTAKQVLSDKGSYHMSFDENAGTNVPMTVPGSSTLTVLGVSENPAEVEALMSSIAADVVQQMEQSFIQQVKELGL